MSKQSKEVIILGPQNSGKSLLCKSIKTLLEDGELLGSRLEGLYPDSGQNILDVEIKLKRKLLFKKIQNFSSFILNYCNEIEKNNKSFQITKLIKYIRSQQLNINIKNNKDNDNDIQDEKKDRDDEDNENDIEDNNLINYYDEQFILKDISEYLIPDWKRLLHNNDNNNNLCIIFVLSLSPRYLWSKIYETFSELWLLLIQLVNINKENNIKKQISLLIYINKIELYDTNLINEAINYFGFNLLKNNSYGISVNIIEGSLLHSKNNNQIIDEDISYDVVLTISKWILLSIL